MPKALRPADPPINLNERLESLMRAVLDRNDGDEREAADDLDQLLSRDPVLRRELYKRLVRGVSSEH